MAVDNVDKITKVLHRVEVLPLSVRTEEDDR